MTFTRQAFWPLILSPFHTRSCYTHFPAKRKVFSFLRSTKWPLLPFSFRIFPTKKPPEKKKERWVMWEEDVTWCKVAKKRKRKMREKKSPQPQQFEGAISSKSLLVKKRAKNALFSPWPHFLCGLAHTPTHPKEKKCFGAASATQEKKCFYYNLGFPTKKENDNGFLLSFSHVRENKAALWLFCKEILEDLMYITVFCSSQSFALFYLKTLSKQLFGKSLTREVFVPFFPVPLFLLHLSCAGMTGFRPKHKLNTFYL